MLVRDLLNAISNSCLSLDDEVFVEVMYRDRDNCMESKKYIEVGRAGMITGIGQYCNLSDGFKICIEGVDLK